MVKKVPGGKGRGKGRKGDDMIKYYISMGISVAVILVIAGLAVMDAEPKQARPRLRRSPSGMQEGDSPLLHELRERGVLQAVTEMLSSGMTSEEVIVEARAPLTQVPSNHVDR